MAEVVLTEELARAGLTGKVTVDSAGTGDWHVGEDMDRRARAELGRRGYDGSGHQARQIQDSWLEDYDLLLAMDRANLDRLRVMARGRAGLAGRIALMLSFDPLAAPGAEVPDPYDGSPDDYAEVFDLVYGAARALVRELSGVLRDCC
jgi:protein-tyrosine phosphatase